jgi:ppGpp synthetase/RelA/SpoT-type nucleotidyltranferase
MGWNEPSYARGQVDKAGRILVSDKASPAEIDSALEILNNWRSSHSFPLNAIQMGIRKACNKYDTNFLVAQRLKRVSSIIQKLRRFPRMDLSRMQDIGGCRAVVASVDAVEELRNRYRNSSIKHELVNEKDYIQSPKSSGYRGIHLIYKYKSDKKQTYNGLQIEIQIRSRLQHAWATAVETVGTFLQNSLKSSEGPEQWLTFFLIWDLYLLILKINLLFLGLRKV